jgi:hypothetical protein
MSAKCILPQIPNPRHSTQPSHCLEARKQRAATQWEKSTGWRFESPRFAIGFFDSQPRPKLRNRPEFRVQLHPELADLGIDFEMGSQQSQLHQHGLWSGRWELKPRPNLQRQPNKRLWHIGRNPELGLSASPDGSMPLLWLNPAQQETKRPNSEAPMCWIFQGLVACATCAPELPS